MRNRIISFAVIMCMIMGAFVPAGFAGARASAAEKFTPRTAVPLYSSAIGKKYYYNKDNIYIASNYGPNSVYIKKRGGYCIGNCTWWAYSRASEILDKKFSVKFCRNADQWLRINKENHIYPYGSKPKVGAIACSGNHVAIVEKIVDGKVYVSESGYKIKSYKPEPESKIYFHYGTPWNSNVDGYIYILDGEFDNDPTYPTTNVDYSVKITSKSLYQRTGPGTEYANEGYVTAGTYKVSKESGNWAFLENGYWVSLNYCTIIKNETTKPTTAPTTKPTTTATEASSEFKIKVTSKDLYMRTGPGTNYKDKGYIKKGTYTVCQVKGDWGKIKENGYWVCLKYATRIAAEEPTTTTQPTTAATTTAATTVAASSKHDKSKFSIKTTAKQTMRSGASSSSKKKGTIKKNKVYGIKAVKKGWGQLSSNGYWIKLKYTKLSGKVNIKTTAKDLNMRTGPSKSKKSKGYLKQGNYTLKAFKDGWGQLTKNGYWISLDYIKLR